MSPLALQMFTMFVRLNPEIPVDDPMLLDVWWVYETTCPEPEPVDA